MRILRATLGCLALSVASATASATTYGFTPLATLGGSSSHAWGVNDAGQVVGISYLPGDTGFAYGALWSSGTSTPSNLGAIGGTSSWAFAIDAGGRAVGWASTAGNATSRPVVWEGGVATPLATTGGGGGAAYAVNGAGLIVGNDGGHAVVWNGTTATSLVSGSDVSSNALGINDLGHIVGSRAVGMVGPATVYHATLWSGGATVDLGTLGGRSSEARDINGSGTIVGSSDLTGNAVTHAALWNGGGPAIDLGALPGGTTSIAYAINEAGLAVGMSYLPALGTSHATLWTGTGIVDLNDLLDPAAVGAGWVLNSAQAINESGWIVGSAQNTVTGLTRGFVLTPVPEPATCLLMALGLVALGSWASRRRRPGSMNPIRLATALNPAERGLGRLRHQ